MIHYLLKRVFLMIPTLIGITIITVGIMLWAPGAPGVEQAGQAMSGGGARLQSSNSLTKAKEKMGFFDKEGNKLMFPVAWWNWTSKKLLRGDLGRSIKYKQKVTTLMADRIPITLLLNFISILIIYFVAIPVGIFSSVNQGTVRDGSTSTLLFIFYSIPSWWSATMLIVFFSSTIFFNWFPVIGLSSEGADRLPLLQFLWDRIQHMVLPITAMTLGGFAMLSRFMRSGMLETIRQDYIRTARAKGVAEHDVIYKHALRNALIPIITLLGGLLPAMIGGSIIIEQIFSIEGMGKLAFDAILARDYMVVMANTFFAAVLTLFGLLVSDILYVFVDPRISLD